MRHTMAGISLVLIALFAVNSGLAGSAQAQDSPKNLYKIYSNLGKTLLGTCYSRTEGWRVGGGQSIAMAFSPTINAEAKVLVLGLLWDLGAGEDVATVSINEDADGVPGKGIHTWTLRNLGKQLWHGCHTSIANSKQGIPLTEGNQYWLVAGLPRLPWMSGHGRTTKLRGRLHTTKMMRAGSPISGS
jgi:hypothetical protein